MKKPLFGQLKKDLNLDVFPMFAQTIAAELLVAVAQREIRVE